MRNLVYLFYMIKYKLLMYTEALSDVEAYVNAAMAPDNYVEPAPTASRSSIYRQHFESSNRLKTTVRSINFDCIRLLVCLLFFPTFSYPFWHICYFTDKLKWKKVQQSNPSIFSMTHLVQICAYPHSIFRHERGHKQLERPRYLAYDTYDAWLRSFFTWPKYMHPLPRP